MTIYSSDFIRIVAERGFLHQCTDMEALDTLSSKSSITAYIGFDCTAPSLHAGSLVSIMLLRWLQKTGHRPIVLMGGGTTKVGDPSGKDETRKLLDDDGIAANMAGIKDIFKTFLDFGDGPTDALMANNADWLDGLQYIPFLRDYGRHFSINRMLGFESVKLRLDREQPLTFLEFNYMILQAYDFLELARRHDCLLQMGGSDQWGNIVGGVELARRLDGRALYGLTTPLLETASGAKMGKTAAGAVWLNKGMLSPYDYWQYWRNTEDADVSGFLRLFTDLPIAEITRLEALEGEECNEAKKILANEATKLCHGETVVGDVAASAASVFENGGVGAIDTGGKPDGAGLPVIDIARGDLEGGIPAFELLTRAGLAASNSESRRLIKGGGGRLNGVVIGNELQSVSMDDMGDEGLIKLSAGKKRHAVVRAV